MVAGQAAAAPLRPTRLRGDYGATAYVTRSWSFAVVDLDRVPRAFMSLDVAVVKQAITRDGVREIPGTADLPKLNGAGLSDSAPSSPARSGRRIGKPAPAADPGLSLTIDPGWGDQKVFRHYRQR
jgi:hypothetical protein